MSRSVHHKPLRRLLLTVMFCGLMLGAGHPAVAHEGGGFNDGGYNGGGYYQGNDHRHDSSYEQGYSLGHKHGYNDGKKACDSDARKRDEGRRFSQGQYDRGYADGYDTGHRAACDDHAHGKPDPSYRQGYRVGYKRGFKDGRKACDSDARHGEDRRRPSQSRYNRGYADGYHAGHRAACD